MNVIRVSQWLVDIMMFYLHHQDAMPRRTVDLSSDLIKQLEHLAADARQSMNQVVNRSLSSGL